MQKVVNIGNVGVIAQYMTPAVFKYIGESRIESFESFDEFVLMAFDWYDIHTERTEDAKIIVYLDENDLFFICTDQASEDYCKSGLERAEAESTNTNLQLLCRFFIRLFRGDTAYLDRFEAEINESIDRLLSGELEDVTANVIAKRQELLRLKHYYEQLDAVFDEFVLADNALLTSDAQNRMAILSARTDRYLSKVTNLQELVSQMQATYESQLSIQQNNLMKFFTVITAIFLPLTLLVGWYGMNFSNMPELTWTYGYPVFCVGSAVLVVWMIWYFKRKKWL